jgi:hypothetical protein
MNKKLDSLEKKSVPYIPNVNFYRSQRSGTEYEKRRRVETPSPHYAFIL